MQKKLLDYIISIVTSPKSTGTRKDLALRVFLYTLSRIFRVIVKVRVFLYKSNVKKAKNFGCAIISVGNITVGGTGKTPVVEMLAKILHEEKRKVAILTRGYKSRSKQPWWNRLNPARWGKSEIKVVSTGQGPLLGVRQAGDEAFMLANNLSGVSIYSCKNRVYSASYALEKGGADTIILDDGFQYLRLGRKLDIVLIDSVNPFGNGNLLPRGVLREPVKHLQRAQCFFLTKANRTSTGELKKLLFKIRPDAVVVECAHVPQHVVDAFSGNQKNLDFLMGKKVYVFSAIASPKGFEDSVNELGAQIAGVERFVDHHNFSDRELRHIVKRAARSGASMILTTEKDAVRLPKIKKNIPIYYLRVKIEIINGKESFNDMLSRVCFY